MSRDMNRDTSDDALRARLGRLDPQPASVPVDPITSLRAQELLERTMTTDLDTPTTSPAPGPRRSRRLVALSAAAAAALVAGGVVLLAGGNDAGAPTPKAESTLALTLPDPLAMSSCLQFDTAVLRGMDLAFAGTARSVSGGSVTLDVTRWYKGGTADVVTLQTPGENTSASLDSVQFRAGGDYLVTATADGHVNGCGFSGEATPDLTRSFDEAFAAQ